MNINFRCLYLLSGKTNFHVKSPYPLSGETCDLPFNHIVSDGALFNISKIHKKLKQHLINIKNYTAHKGVAAGTQKTQLRTIIFAYRPYFLRTAYFYLHLFRLLNYLYV